MALKQISSIGGTAALLLPEDVLQSLGLSVGDNVDVSVSEGRLVLRSLSEVEREETLRAITDRVFERRQSAYLELAEGAA